MIVQFTALSRERLTPDNVDVVVITHGHPDHYANVNLFRTKPTMFGTVEVSQSRIANTMLTQVCLLHTYINTHFIAPIPTTNTQHGIVEDTGSYTE
jgi:glyoxylase-like metal-dependent hydrolase (beta-lactamase superfamily II)